MSRINFYVNFWPKEKDQHILVCERKSGCSPDVAGYFSEF